MRLFLFILLFPLWGVSQDAEAVIASTTIPNANTAGNSIALTPISPNRTIYVATDGLFSNDGLTTGAPINMDRAFDPNFVQAGDLFYIKAGNYTYGAATTQYNLSNFPCTQADPCYWIGYQTTPGDINATEYSTVSYTDYQANAQAPGIITNLRSLDTTLMPTFTGPTGSAPNFLSGGNLFYTDGGEEGFVFRNLQIQYFRRGWWMNRIDYSVWDNIVSANLGWFAPTPGQGGTNSDLQGTAIFIYGPEPSNITTAPKYNKIQNSAFYNHAFRAVTIGSSQFTLVQNSKAYSDVDEGNPQDYYFHTIGKYNKFSKADAYRLISSNHSGHGICFNQLSEYNYALNCYIEGTNAHLDGSTYGLMDGMTIVRRPDLPLGVQSYRLYVGGGVSAIDNANNNVVKNTSLSSVSFSDSDKNPYPEDAGNWNVFDNLDFDPSGASVPISFFWWATLSQGASNNYFKNSTFNDYPYLFNVDRYNYNTKIINSTITNVGNMYTSDKGLDVTVGGLDPLTEFQDITFVNSSTLETDAIANYVVTTTGGGGNTKPVITLEGNGAIYLTVGDTYIEDGATATDVEDGDITSDIVITGTVNTAIAATYFRNYNVTDSGSLAADQVTRTIIVSNVPPPPTNNITKGRGKKGLIIFN